MVITGRTRVADSAAAQAPAAPAAVQAPAVTAPIPVGPGGSLPDFSRIAERIVPAVANISSTQIVRRQNSPFADDPFFPFFGGQEEFFGRPRAENSLGSGVIISPDGYILTNNHVITGEQRGGRVDLAGVTVSLSDKREMPATLVGVDPATDLALLKVEARNLPTIGWGDSSNLKVAERVLAVGNPFQLNQTVTLGIVSAIGRNNIGLAQYEDFIQTDAAINPGNSGGALVNARGELIGINTAIFSRSGGYQGIGFAVPSNLARRIFTELQEHGEVRRGSIGAMEIAPLTTQLAERLGATDTRGVVIMQMARRSPAAVAGLRPGDIIVRFNGTAITDGSQLSRAVQDAPIGSTVTLTIIRDGRQTDVRVPIAG